MKIHWPWNNLGCFGIRIGNFYGDFFITPYIGIFWTDGKEKHYRRLWG